MLFNLSFKNIKKSMKDYTIYFFTLVIAVAIFYTFNSIESQQSMMILNESKTEMIDVLVMILNYISVFVSIILGFLIIYSNNFLIKRRKKELGLYLTLGMSKRKVSTILVIETMLVGLVSLGVGLLVGIFASQFLSIFTANLFQANMSKFQFIFSANACLKTLLYFASIYLLVMFFNIVSLSRYKLIDLLTAHKKNEKVKFRNKYIIIISFILSLALLGWAYSLLFDGAFFKTGTDNKALLMIITGVLGTFFLFFSIAGFALKVFQMNKNIYYKDLNIFILRQINSKINTTVFSTTVICIMLLLTIGILSGSMSLSSAFNEDLRENNLTDYTLLTYENDSEDSEKLHNAMISNKQFSNYVENYILFPTYTYDNFTFNSLFNNKTKKQIEKKYGGQIKLDIEIPIILESDYKKLMNYLNKKVIDIKDDEYLILANINEMVQYYNISLKENNNVVLIDKTLTPSLNEVYNTAITNNTTAGNLGLVVVSDKYGNLLKKYNTIMIGNYNDGDFEKMEKGIYDILTASKDQVFENGGSYTFLTKMEMEASSVGLKAILTFVGLYLGIIFAISSATVLAIGQLSDSSDNKERFKVLRQLGADEAMIKKALFIQIAIAFILPLIVAVIHAIFGLRELNSLVEMLANINLTKNIIITTGFIIIVYGGYLLATYLSSKTIINEKN